MISIYGTFNYIAEKWKYWKNFGAIIGSFQYMNEESEIIKPRPPRILTNGPIDLSLGPPRIRLHQVSTFFQETLWVRLGICQ